MKETGHKRAALGAVPAPGSRRTRSASARERTSGFNPARPGYIHLLCPKCGRKHSNARRDKHDPARAFVCVVPCPECSVGCFVEGPDEYLFKNGRPLPTCWECDGWVHDTSCRHANRVRGRQS